MISGLSFKKNSNCHICIIDDLTSDLKGLIRKNLTSICHGPYRASEHPKIFNYKTTLKEFLESYDNSIMSTRVGMLGELLAHVLIREKIKRLKPLSLYLNQEERVIKKGFDIIYGETSKVWIAEVKSGEKGVKNEIQRHRHLLNDAKKDLSTRLAENVIARWRGALAGLDILRKRKSDKMKLQEILQKRYLDAVKGDSRSNETSAILVSVLFSGDNPIAARELRPILDTIMEENLFKEILFFAIQKTTIGKVEQFIREEAE